LKQKNIENKLKIKPANYILRKNLKEKISKHYELALFKNQTHMVD